MKNKYMKFDCPECGALLEVWAEEVIDNMPKFHVGENTHEARFLIRHCKQCGSDWENIWCTEDHETSETPLKRKFWG